MYWSEYKRNYERSLKQKILDDRSRLKNIYAGKPVPIDVLPPLNPNNNTLMASQSVPVLPRPDHSRCTVEDKVTMTDAELQPKQTQTESKPPMLKKQEEIQTYLKGHHLEKNVYSEPNNQSIDQLRYQLRMKHAADMQNRIYHTFLEHQRYSTPEKVRYAQTLENPTPSHNEFNYSP